MEHTLVIDQHPILGLYSSRGVVIKNESDLRVHLDPFAQNRKDYSELDSTAIVIHLFMSSLKEFDPWFVLSYRW